MAALLLGTSPGTLNACYNNETERNNEDRFVSYAAQSERGCVNDRRVVAAGNEMVVTVATRDLVGAARRVCFRTELGQGREESAMCCTDVPNRTIVLSCERISNFEVLKLCG